MRTQEPFREEGHKNERWRIQEKKKEGKCKKRRKKRKNRNKAKCKKSTRTRWWSKIGKSFVEVKCEVRQGETRPGTMEKMAFSLFAAGTKHDRCKRRTAVVFRMRGELQFKEERQTKSVSYRWKQPKGEDWTENKKEARFFRCTLINGSAWSTDREEVHEKIQRKVRYLLWCRGQIGEEGRMDICSGCSKNHG